LNDTGLACSNQSFAAPRSQPASTSPLWVAKGDFNGDGHADVVVGNNLSGSPDAVSVLLSSGAGLTPSGTFSTGTGTQVPGELAVADLAGDGRLDVVAPNNGSKNLSILPGLGGGSLGAAIVLPLGGPAGPQAVATGDFNGDGKIDIAVSNGTTNNVTVFLNTG